MRPRKTVPPESNRGGGGGGGGGGAYRGRVSSINLCPTGPKCSPANRRFHRHCNYRNTRCAGPWCHRSRSELQSWRILLESYDAQLTGCGVRRSGPRTTQSRPISTGYIDSRGLLQQGCVSGSQSARQSGNHFPQWRSHAGEGGGQGGYSGLLLHLQSRWNQRSTRCPRMKRYRGRRSWLGC